APCSLRPRYVVTPLLSPIRSYLCKEPVLLGCTRRWISFSVLASQSARVSVASEGNHTSAVVLLVDDVTRCSHRTHAHSAWAVAVHAKRANPPITCTLPNCIIGSAPTDPAPP